MKTRKIFAWLLSFALILSNIPVAFAASDGLSLSVEASALEIYDGETVDFTVYLNGADTVDGGIRGGSFWLDIPEGLSVVPDSFVASDAMGMTVSVNETTMGVAFAGDAFSGEHGMLATFSCTADGTVGGALRVGFAADSDTMLSGEENDYYWDNGAITLESVEIVYAGVAEPVAQLSLSVETEATEVSVGGVVDYTVYLNGADTVDGGIRGGSFWLDIPEGLSVVPGSFVSSGATGLTVSVNETSMGVAFAGNSGYTGEKGALASFSCVVDETAFGELAVGIACNENTELCGETVDYSWMNGDFSLVPAWITVMEMWDPAWNLSLSVETDITEVSVGSVIDFTVYLNGADTVDGGIFGGSCWLDIPEGLSVVPGSFASSGATGLMVSVNETTMGIALAGTNGYTGEKGALASFSCVVDETAFGELVVGIAGNENTELCGETVDYSWMNGDFSLVPAWIVVENTVSGELGNGLTWELTGGVLTIRGEGEMWPLSCGNTPWYAYREQITSAVIEDGITNIGSEAFCGCYMMESITIPASVTYIGDWAFENCAALTSVTYTGGEQMWTLVQIEYGNECLTGAELICTGVDVFEDTCGDNIIWEIVDGVLTISGTGEMWRFGCQDSPWYDYREIITSVVIEDGVTSIGGEAFCGLSAMESITIPASVTYIGGYAFENCTALTSVTYNGSTVKWSLVRIGYGNEYLTGIEPTFTVVNDAEGTCGDNVIWELSGSVLTISGTGGMGGFGCQDSPWYAYREIITSVVIEDGVTSIGGEAFCGLSAMESITIPASVTYISSWAFENCTALTSVTYTGGPLRWAGMQIENGNECLTSANVTCTGVDVLEGSCGDNVTWAIADGVLTISGSGTMHYFNQGGAPWYAYRALFERAVIASGVTSIGRSAFYGCDNLTSVEIADSVTRIDWGAFMNCSALAEITIPAGVTNIGDYAFHYCTALTAIVIPDGVMQISHGAFSYCTNLASITIPASVTYIGSEAFYNCTALKNVTYNGSDEQWAAVEIEYGNGCLLNIMGAEGVCGDDLTWMFADGVLTISGTGAMYDFECCNTPWYSCCDAINSVIIEDGVTSIGSEAFCSGRFSSIEIPVSVTGIGDLAFCGCSEQFLVLYGGTEEQWNQIQIGNNNENLNNATILYNGTLYGEGTCGDNLTWVFDNGVLTISGTGEMWNFDCQNSPWYAYRELITSAVIADGVTSIGGEAFCGLSAMESITISASVTYIGNWAFENCAALTDIVIPNGVMGIGNGTFNGCTALTSITIPASVTYIDSYAFENCTALKTVTFTGGPLQWAGMWIEYGNECLTSATVTCTGVDVTSGECGDAVVWNLSDDGVLTISGTGEMYDYDQFGAPWCAYGWLIEHVVIEDGVTNIGDSAFFECNNLTRVEIAESVTRIEWGAFQNCPALSSIEIPNGVTYIGNYAFQNCVVLTEIVIPDGVTQISNGTFSNCSGLAIITIPASVTYINRRAFENCTALTSVTYTGGPLKWAGMQIDEGNECLTSANIICTGEDVLEGSCGDNVTWNFSDGVLTISGTGEMWDFGCQSSPWYAYRELITSAVIADGVTSIGREAFCGLSAMESITIPASVTYIGNYAFENCTALTEVVIPDGVTQIRYGTFSYCTSLASVTIPVSVTRIYREAFYNCTALATVYYNGLELLWETIQIDENNDPLLSAEVVFVGMGDEEIVASGACGESVTWTLTNQGALTISGTGAMDDYDWRNSPPWTEYAASIYVVVVEDGVTRVGDQAFCDRYADTLVSVTLADSVTSIGGYAFERCGRLESIELPENLVSIGMRAFANCSNLRTISIPASVTEIGEQAFVSCNALESITVNDSNTAYADDNGVLLNKDMTNLICYPAGRSAQEYVVPATVKTISSEAFFDASLLAIVLPSGLEIIEWDAFAYCSGLKTIFIPASVTEIGNGALRGCWDLTAITVDRNNAAFTSVDGILFSMDMKRLLTYPAGRMATEYAIPAGVTEIDDNAFEQNGYLTKVTIPGSVKEISPNAFWNCRSLATVEIGSGVQKIGARAFALCYQLTTITIPGSVTSIENSAFVSCTNLAKVVFAGTSEQWAKLSVGSNNEWLKNAAVEFAGGSVLLGDVNGDRTINLGDVQLLFMFTRGKAEITAEGLAASDVNNDGTVNLGDVQLLFMFTRGKATLG